MNLHNLLLKQTLPHTILLCILFIAGCQNDVNRNKKLKLEDIFQNPPVSITSVTKSYVSKVTTGAINDLNEPILCMSTRIEGQSTTYFIQPDKAPLDDIDIKYSDAQVADMGSALLINDQESNKTTLFYLPGKFPIDSLHIRPDAIYPVLGITMYQSEIEKISSRWTDVVCKCVSESALYDFKEQKINCDTGGNVESSCLLSNEGSVLKCKTNCRQGAMACCWFEF